MGYRFYIKILCTCFFTSVFFTITSCNKDDLTREERIAQSEQNILTGFVEIIPSSVLSLFKEHFNAIRDEGDYDSYLDSLEASLNELKRVTIENFSAEAFRKALDESFSEFQKKSFIRCSGLGYAKGISIDLSLAGETGEDIKNALQASGGGGVKIVYDFVNLDRQVYYYSFCSDGFSFEDETAGVLAAGTGFTGINEVITGIKYLDNSSPERKFERSGQSGSFSLPGTLADFFGIGTLPFIGSSTEAMADFSGIANMGSCPLGMIEVENATSTHFFRVPGSLSDGSASEIAMAFSSGSLGLNFRGVTDTYEKYASDRLLAGIKMAKELLLESPLPGLISGKTDTDLKASSASLIHGLEEFAFCPSRMPSLGTRPVNTFSNTTAECGGIITDDGGSWIKVRGVIWSTDEDPGWDNKLGFTKDGQGTGQYPSTIYGLLPNTVYYIRAYATSNAGTAYGSTIRLKTNESPNFTPLKPAIPVPVSGAVDVIISAALSWNCTDPDNDPLTYDVYLDTSNPPIAQVSSGQTATTLAVNGLSNGIRYFWKVVAKDDSNNSTEGSVWSFTTENPTLVNTFGPGNSYLPDQGWTLGNSFSDFFVHGIGFIPVASGNVSRYKIAVFHKTGGARLDAMLMSDTGNRPGTLIEKFSFIVPGGTDDLMISANSPGHPQLASGTRYWLVVAPPENSGDLFGWYRNPHINGVFNASARGWDLSWITIEDAGYTPTLRIEGVAK